MIGLINIIGIVLILGVIWWFWLYHPHSKIKANNDKPIEILVEDGVYNPSVIDAVVGRPLTLRFLRKDSSPCSKTVLFEDFGISEELPLNKSKDIVITPSKTGHFEFTCQMKMYRGRLEVSNDFNGA